MQSNASFSGDPSNNLTQIQERAARSVGVDEATPWRWLQDKDFHKRYIDLRRECVSQSIARLQQASTEAVNTLREIVKDKKQPAPSRVSAAKAIL